MSGVFISYRRDDSADFTDRLAEYLRREFGEDEIFLDVLSISTGTQFTSELNSRLKESNVVLVVIGPNWLRNGSGVARIEESGDYVRKEIETALHCHIRLIPVLTGRAKMPTKAELPESLGEFTTWQAIEISRDHYQSDVEGLVQTLQKLVKPSREKLLHLLAAQQYDSAIKALTRATENFPIDADQHFYLALALLRGRYPRTLSLGEAREIENHLRISCNLNPEAAHPYLVWASLKWDFFVVNGFSRPEEAWALLQEAQGRTLNAEALRAIRSTVRVSKGSPLADIQLEARQDP
jgi:tetratricopeptide (TPR) repeat protein